MSFRQIRKLPGMDNIVKDLAEKLQRAQADQGVEDITLFRQNRIDYDAIAFADTGAQALNGDRTDIDSVVYADAEAATLQASGQFTIADKDDGSDQSQPLKICFGDVG